MRFSINGFNLAALLDKPCAMLAAGAHGLNTIRVRCDQGAPQTGSEGHYRTLPIRPRHSTTVIVAGGSHVGGGCDGGAARLLWVAHADRMLLNLGKLLSRAPPPLPSTTTTSPV